MTTVEQRRAWVRTKVVARDAAIELTAPDGMTIRPLSPYRFEQRGSRSIVFHLPWCRK